MALFTLTRFSMVFPFLFNKLRRCKIICLIYTYKYICEVNSIYIWDKIFKNGPSKICGRQLLISLGELQNNASQS